MKNKKIIGITTITALLLFSVFLGATFAYLISQDKANNYFIVGENTVEISEDFVPPPKLEPDVQFTKKACCQ